MKLGLIQQAITEHKFTEPTKQKLRILTKHLGNDSAIRIIESYNVSPRDYQTWLDVIIGFAADEGININRKSDFADVAGAVLENDPAPLDVDMQHAIINTLWAKYKVQKQHSKVEKIVQSQEEDEQLSKAVARMRGFEEDDEEQHSRKMHEFDTNNYSSNYTNSFDDISQILYDDDEEDEDDHDDFIKTHRNRANSARDNSDYQKAASNKYSPTEYYADPTQSNKLDDFSSPFSKGQLVTNKKDGEQYKVEIPDGPADMVGVLINNRIKMVPAKDLQSPTHKEEEDEENTKRPKKQPSFLYDVLTGKATPKHLAQLQQTVEIEGSNAWTNHHAKMPKNPYQKGSIAHKAWERGVKKAAHDIWAPKQVIQIQTKKKPTKK